jgi:hypothetical protein
VIGELLGVDRISNPVKPDERTISGRRYNTVGSPRAVMPTMMSFPMSRAFRPERQGCVWDATQQTFDEPNAEEHELIMGFKPRPTAAPNVTDRQRRARL